MFCEEISKNFEVEFKIHEVTVKSHAEVQLTEELLEIYLEFLGEKIETAEEENSKISTANEVYKTDHRFSLKNTKSEISNEEFVFKTFGEPIASKFRVKDE
jgi:hypothetical protein